MASSSSIFASRADAAQTRVLPGHKQSIQTNDHAIGFTGGFAGATGFLYRHYIGNTFIQANVLPLMLDRGEFMMLMGGMSVGRYLIVWHSARGTSILPNTTALRTVALGSISHTNSTDTSSCSGSTCPDPQETIEKKYSLAGGVGFEFGALMRHGFSLSVDLLYTAWWDEKGFNSLLPLPYGTIVYNW